MTSRFSRFAALLMAAGCSRANGEPAPHDQKGHGAPPAPASVPAGHADRAAESEHGSGSHQPASRDDVLEGTPADLEGYAAFTLNRAQAAAVGLKVASAEERDFKKTMRTTGFVVLDETRTSHVHSKVRGWIERVSVDFVGKRVAAGTPLCSIYSQEVLAAQLEYLAVLDQAQSRPALTGALGEAEAQARMQLMAAARRRLSLWDVPAAEIDRLERTRTPQRTFTLAAPRSGIVVSRQALPGMFIDPSVELYIVSDVKKLWLLADIYETDVSWVKLGAAAKLSIEGLADSREARVSFIPPTVEEATRTLKVRFDLDNEDGKLRPGTFATVEMNVDLGRALAIPETSVIHAGRKSVVFVVSGERIEPRPVKLGPLVDAYYRVDSGLRAGESVAVGAQFLIDSESRLRATTGQGPSHGGH